MSETAITPETTTSRIASRVGARDIALIAVFAGVTAALGALPPIPMPTGVPITAQTLGVILAGAILGPLRGGLSQLLFVALALVGLPLFSGGRGGIEVLFGVTAGFIISWPIAAALIGWSTYRFNNPYTIWKGAIINVVFGIVFVYALGIVGMMAIGKMTFYTALVGNLPFLVGDAIKVALVVLIAKGVHSALPGLMPARPQQLVTLPEGA
ncbi:MAG: biotin transporter BioY [Propionibacteriaceae bacterium]|jgi:biotin transport system substrate-specific component|nr:biotin transporter BioY [Propionibacteriaceae bacterium]